MSKMAACGSCGIEHLRRIKDSVAAYQIGAALKVLPVHKVHVSSK